MYQMPHPYVVEKASIHFRDVSDLKGQVLPSESSHMG